MSNENILQAMLPDLDYADDEVLESCACNGRKEIFDQLLTRKFYPEKSDALWWSAMQTDDIYHCKNFWSSDLV